MKEEIKQKLYKIGEVAELLGVHEDTLRNWEKQGFVVPERIGRRGDRRYTVNHIREIKEKGLVSDLAKKGQKIEKDFSEYTKNELIKELQILKKQKKYGLVWEDHVEEVVERCKIEAPILVSKKEKQIKDKDLNKPTNILIEGDNYHALQVLNYTHKNSIDVVYIDPPYNTGNKDFKYNDTFVDAEDSYRHSKWLSFMNKRLRLAKNLLSKNGVILIHIDEHEMPRLLLICEELFEDKNVDCLVWQKTDAKVDKNTNAKIINRQKTIHEYLVICYKNKMSTRFDKILKLPEWKKEKSNPDHDPRGPWESGIISFEEGHENEEIDSEYYFEIILPSKRIMRRHFFVTELEFKKLRADNRIYFPKSGDGVPRLKIFQNEEKEFFLDSIMTGFGTSSTAKEELIEIFGSLAFETPQPTKLGVELLRVVSKKQSIILDFFAGSGTVGHSILELNKQDKGNRKFILCTDNENKIAEKVCYPRIEKIIEGYKNNKRKKISGLGGSLEYFKTEFVDVENIKNVSDKKKLEFTYEAGQMIALKEDTFKEIEKNKNYQIFTDEKDKYVGIYFRENLDKLSEMENKILDKKDVKLYIFSHGGNDFINDYAEYKNVSVEHIPEPILKIYKSLNN